MEVLPTDLEMDLVQVFLIHALTEILYQCWEDPRAQRLCVKIQISIL